MNELVLYNQKHLVMDFLSSNLRSSSVGPTVFREPWNFKPSREIWPLPQNFRVSAEFHRILRKHRNSAATAKFRKSVLLL